MPHQLLCSALARPLSTPLSGVPEGGWTGDFLTGALPAGVSFARASTATCYGPTGVLQRVNINVPRFDYVPTTGQLRGLLLEGSATNLRQFSEQFDEAYWLKNGLNAFGSGSLANTTATLAPDGTNNADYIQEDTTTGCSWAPPKQPLPCPIP